MNTEATINPGSRSQRQPAAAGGLWERRELIAQLSRREVAMRYRGAILGIFWSFITPLLMLAIYTFVFSVIFNNRATAPPSDSAAQQQFFQQLTERKAYFALWLFAALIPFTVFAEVANKAPGIVLAVPNYVKKVVFPLEVLPVAAVAGVVVHSVISVGILLVGVATLLGVASPTVLWLPVAYVPLVLLALGVGWLLSSLGMYLRDLGQAVGPAVQMLSFLTPMFYPLEQLPKWAQPFMKLNPLTEIVENFRRVVLWRQGIDWGSWAGVTAFSAVLAVGGYVWFMKTKRGFADVL